MEINSTNLFIIIAVIIGSLYLAWRKISKLESKVDRLEDFLDTAYKKVESLEQDLLEKKIIHNHYKSKEELRRDRINKELDKERDDLIKNG